MEYHIKSLMGGKGKIRRARRINTELMSNTDLKARASLLDSSFTACKAVNKNIQAVKTSVVEIRNDLTSGPPYN